jgi:aryl-alcohol dehydrogenase-like predicted oxidoreductase
MDRFRLSPSGPEVSRLVLGTMTFGKQVDEQTAASMVDIGLERGINFIDTANVYNAGAAEVMLGRVLRGRRGRVVLATKVGIKMGDQPDQIGLSRRTIHAQIEQSLRRLQTDYVDLYYLHQPDPQTPLEESLATVEELVRQGKVRQVGASNYAAWQLCRMHALADAAGHQRLSVVQPLYNLLARRIEPELLPACRELDVRSVVYNPLAGGLLTGKHAAAHPPASGTRFDGNAAYQSRYWHNENFAAMQRLATAAETEGRTLVSVALNWLLHNTPVDGIILGASSLAQLQENLAATEDGSCSAETLTICEDVWQTLRGIAPAYHR